MTDKKEQEYPSQVLAPFTLKLNKLDPTNLFIKRFQNFKAKQSLTYFDRRVTCIEWHTHSDFPFVLILASKGGDLLWIETNKDLPLTPPSIQGVGAGGSITALKIDSSHPNMIYTTSIDGTFKKQDFEGKNSTIFLDTMNKEKWYTALDVQKDSSVIGIGSNTGELTLKDRDGNTFFKSRISKSKIHDLNFHPTESHYFVTAGHDKFVKLWDLRMIRQESTNPVKTLEQGGVLNSACFSNLPPFPLLTTAQPNECRVYNSLLRMESNESDIILLHPHRPFQHLTPIVASWHPSIPNIFTIGRYPESSEDKRTIDAFQTHGKEIRCVARIQDEHVSGIQCITKLNKTGETMASCSGFTTFLWDSFNSPSSLMSKSKSSRTSSSTSNLNKKIKTK